MKKIFSVIVVLLCVLVTSGCIGDIYLFSDGTDPLKEFKLSNGPGYGKILLIPVNGTISMDSKTEDMFLTRPGMVQEVVSQLDKAANDSRIKAVVLMINSPGGTVTASDIIYNEIMRFKKNTGKKVYAMMFDIAASGGYYVALPADMIFAHPTTITGSVGVIFMHPDISGLMKIIGVKVDVSKSGDLKDMGSPFKETSGEEALVFEGLVSDFAERFYSVVKAHRKISDADFETVKSARIFTAREACKIGLVDKIGYIDDLLAQATEDTNAYDVIVYRRLEYNNDNPYIMETQNSLRTPELINTGILGKTSSFDANFYYIWPSVLP